MCMCVLYSNVNMVKDAVIFYALYTGMLSYTKARCSPADSGPADAGGVLSEGSPWYFLRKFVEDPDWVLTVMVVPVKETVFLIPLESALLLQ